MNDAVAACSILRAAEFHCRAPLVPENQQSTGDPAKYWTHPRTFCGLFSQQMINQRLGKRRQRRLAAGADLEVTLGPAVIHCNDRQWVTPGQFHRLTWYQADAYATPAKMSELVCSSRLTLTCGWRARNAARSFGR